MSATASRPQPSPSAPREDEAPLAGGPVEALGHVAHEHVEHEDAGVILPFLGILIAIAVPFGLAVAAGAGGGIGVTCLGILAIVVMLLALTRVLGRIMGDAR